jgi:DNA-binding NtrC family response regulator
LKILSSPRTPILLVEPDSILRALLAKRLPAQIDQHARFETARPRLDRVHYDLIVANLRLGAYNGLQLVHLARLSGAATHAVVYDERLSVALVREVQQAGALFEVTHRLPITLPAYVGAALPASDRRNPIVPDRRVVRRGGRRRWDRHVLAVDASAAG